MSPLPPTTAPSPATSCARSSSATSSTAPTPAAASPARPATPRTTRPRPLDPARIRTRFPPEPNGYLHVGHAKSICLNFGLARDYGGVCHLRFDDTNPEKEEQEYVDAIVEAVQLAGLRLARRTASQPPLLRQQLLRLHVPRRRGADRAPAWPTSTSRAPSEMRANRGDFNTPGTDSPFRDRTPAENLARFREMRDGQHADGAAVLRAQHRHGLAQHQPARPGALPHQARRRTTTPATRWCIYPMYTYAHPIEDALERITHSICTLEFEDQRPFYDWLLDTLCDLGLLAQPRPHQYEFGRLNLTYVITSKRKLQAAGRREASSTAGTTRACPRSSACAGAATRRRAIRADGRAHRRQQGRQLDRLRELDIALRDDLEGQAPRAMAVLDPVKLELDQLGRGLRQRRPRRTLPGAGAPAAARTRPAPLRPRPARSGSSATTSPRCRPRASSASSPATRCA